MSQQQLNNYAEVRAISDIAIDKNTLTGYAAVYNKRSINFGTGQRPLYEIIETGAFRNTISDGHNILALYNHNLDMVLGSTSAGTLKLSDDTNGLRYSIEMPDTQYAADVKALVARGDVRGGSFRFNGTATITKDKDGSMIRTVSDIKTGEITITASPAYPDTTVALRSLADFEKEQQRNFANGIEILKRKFNLYTKL